MRLNRLPAERGFGMQGMTLIELMIVIVIVGILAAIAYPSYQRQVQQTRRSDGKVMLLEVAQRLERCYTRYNSYNHDSCDTDDDLEDDGIASQEGWYVITNTNRSASTFTLQATPQGAQTNDTRCGSLTVTHTGARGAGGPIELCW